MYSFFALVSRMKNIARWSLMRNSSPENVQEHSHMTAVLAHALAVIRRDVFGVPCDPGAAASAALFHDASEILTGDMPTPIKYLNSQLTTAYKDAERAACDRLLSRLPEQLRGAYSPLLSGGGDDATRALVHAADKLAAYIKCLEEERAGNREFRLAAEQTLAKLKSLALPEVDYFLEHFMPPFELTIDELNT
ncbi:MAG: 5'-deoxynucleotidase [Oscillospiraceae bacterium]|jgi:5'-deoxynucleotidase|nr:5'-deoxynucleotidase [Oscillospiraceae bacterium]